jgi:O-antigen/teichoic acid export membrane protein
MSGDDGTVISSSPELLGENVFRQGISYVLPAHLVRVALLFGGWAIAARFLSPDDFGTFVLLTVAAELLALISDFGMTATIVRYLSAGTIDAKHAIAVASGFLLMTSITVFVAVLFRGEDLLALLHARRGAAVSASLAILFVCQYYQAGLSAFLQGLHKYRRVAIVQIVEASLRITLVVICVATLNLGLNGLIGAAICSSAVSAIVAYGSMPWLIVPRIDLPVLRQMLGFGAALQVQSVMGFAFERTDVVLLGAMAGAPGVAAYDVAYKGPNQVRGLFVAFRSVFFPHIAGHYGAGRTAEAERFLRSTLRTVSCGLAGATLITALYGRELVSIVFSPAYADSGPVCAVLMAGVSIGLCNFLIGLALIASGRPRVVLRAAVPEAAINIMANLLLIPAFGAFGAAGASVLSRSIVNPLFLWQLPRTAIWPTAVSYLRSFLNCGVAYAASLLVSPLGHWGKALSLCLFVALSLRFSGLTWADMTFRHAGVGGPARRVTS